MKQNVITAFFGDLALLPHPGFWSPHVLGIVDWRTFPSLKEGQLDSAHLEVKNLTHYLFGIPAIREAHG